ncbi:MAG: hypothetical protein RR795_01555 [Cetobacterium sp.]|uniref:hypothetical protein n=1 Tax=Cetobacterium sp. TaxID=2071632 RepID=UPI002FC5AADE
MARKKIEKYGEKFDNDFEVAFYEYLKNKNIKFEVHKKVNLINKSEFGKEIDWNIDFYLTDLDIYIDIKGLNKTILYENLKKRLFKELYGDKIYFFCEAPVWYQREFGIKWIEYEVKNKIEVLVRAFRKKEEIKRLTNKVCISELTEKIKEKKLFGFQV